MSCTVAHTRTHLRDLDPLRLHSFPVERDLQLLALALSRWHHDRPSRRKESYAIQMLVSPHNFAPQSTLEPVNRQLKVIGEDANRRANAGSFFAEISHNAWMNSTNEAKAEQRGLID
jgi:hypothetical protein